MGVAYEFHFGVGPGLVMCAIVLPDVIVNGLPGKFGVQGTGLAVQTRAIVVVDAVGDVAGLLYLKQIATSADGMHAAGRKEEDVARCHCVVGERIHYPAIGHQAGIFPGSYFLLESEIEMGARGGVHHIPHLGLALATMTLCGCLVIGMYLNAEVRMSVDELYEEGELAAVDLVQGLSGERSLLYYGFTALIPGEHPVFGAPYKFLEDRLESEYHFALPWFATAACLAASTAGSAR